MKTLFRVNSILFLLFAFYSISICQLKVDSATVRSDSTKQNDSAYRSEYTFSEADTLVAKSEYVKAVWFYINLYSSHPKESVESVRNLKSKVKDVISLVRMSFTIYGPFDPELSNFSNGSLQVKSDKLKAKGKWADSIIEELKK